MDSKEREKENTKVLFFNVEAKYTLVKGEKKIII